MTDFAGEIEEQAFAFIDDGLDPVRFAVKSKGARDWEVSDWSRE